MLIFSHPTFSFFFILRLYHLTFLDLSFLESSISLSLSYTLNLLRSMFFHEDFDRTRSNLLSEVSWCLPFSFAPNDSIDSFFFVFSLTLSPPEIAGDLDSFRLPCFLVCQVRMSIREIRSDFIRSVSLAFEHFRFHVLPARENTQPVT